MSYFHIALYPRDESRRVFVSAVGVGDIIISTTANTERACVYPAHVIDGRLAAIAAANPDFDAYLVNANDRAANFGGDDAPPRRYRILSINPRTSTRTILSNAYASESLARAHIRQAVRTGSVAEYIVIFDDRDDARQADGSAITDPKFVLFTALRDKRESDVFNTAFVAFDADDHARGMSQRYTFDRRSATQFDHARAVALAAELNASNRLRIYSLKLA